MSLNLFNLCNFVFLQNYALINNHGANIQGTCTGHVRYASDVYNLTFKPNMCVNSNLFENINFYS